VAVNVDEVKVDQIEAANGIDKFRRDLIEPHAKGLVLETCIGTNRNHKYYNLNSVVKVFGVDWVQYNVEKAI
jgi:hypothetical protein